MPKTLIVPSSRVRLAPVSVRDDGSIDQPPGTLLEGDDGKLIGAVSSVTTGQPVEEADSAGAAKRNAYTAPFTDAALATVQSKIAAATVSDTGLPKDWTPKAQKL